MRHIWIFCAKELEITENQNPRCFKLMQLKKLKINLSSVCLKVGAFLIPIFRKERDFLWGFYAVTERSAMQRPPFIPVYASVSLHRYGGKEKAIDHLL